MSSGRSDDSGTDRGPDAEGERPTEGAPEGEGPRASAPEPEGPPDEERRAVEEVYFPPDVARFLAEFTRALQKHAMYPPAHPALRPAISRAYSALEPLLESRHELAVGVGRRRLAVGETETDPQNPLLGALATQLHAQDLSTLVFRPGVREDELAALLARLSLDPRRSAPPLGRQIETVAASWPHVLLRPVRYEGLGLAWSRGAGAGKEERARADRLWLGLAGLLAPAGLPGAAVAPSGPGRGEGAIGGATAGSDASERDGEAESPAPEELARTLEEGSRDGAYARRAFEGLSELSRELRRAGAATDRALQRRISRFVSLLDPPALERVLGTAAPEERHFFLRDGARWMDPSTVVKLVRATGAIEGHDLSNPLLLLMAKMARYADSQAPDLRPEAETSLRNQVERLLSGWAREYDPPEAYREVLGRMAFSEPERTDLREPTHGADPRHVLRIGLLVDKIGPAVWKATASLMQSRRFRELVDALELAPDSLAAREVWEELASAKAVRWILQPFDDGEEGPDLDVLDRFVARVGAAAAVPMLDRLASAESPDLRGELFSRLADLGPAIAGELLDRLDDGRWWVRRNALALLGRTGGWPPTWSPHPHARDGHPAVRAEALELLLRFRDQRDRAICALLAEESERSRRIGLEAAREAAPPEATPLLLEALEDEGRAEEERVLALGALAALDAPELDERLPDLAGRRAGGLFVLLGPFRPWRIRVGSPLVLAALAVLARRRPEGGSGGAVLVRARRSEDQEVRAAAYGRLREPARGDGPDGPAAPREPEWVPGPEDARGGHVPAPGEAGRGSMAEG